MREKKRYIVFQVVSRQPVTAQQVADAILLECHAFLGEQGMARAGLIILHDRWQSASQKGILRVSHKETANIRAALMFVKSIGNTEALIRSIGMSGILKKAVQRFIHAHKQDIATVG